MKQIVVALAGQPNVGKSSLINAISNAKLKVGNFSGVTVDKTEVVFKMCHEQSCEDYEVHIIDLPGAYSLTEYTIEEKVTKSFLQSDEYDIIVNVVDSTNLQRNLLFTTQLLETGKKVVVALNMSDEAEKEGIEIDEKQLSAILGVPCIKTSANTKEGIEELKKAIVEVYEKEETTSKVIYSDPIEEEIDRIVTFMKEKNYKSDLPYRHLAVKLLQEDEDVYKKMHDEPIWIELLPIIREALQHIYLHTGTKNLEEIFADEHFAFAKGAKMEVMSVKSMKAKNLTQKIDNLLINKILGIPLFLFFMWALFQLTFELGAIPMDWIDAGFVWLADQARTLLGNGEMASLIADGIIGGVGAVIMFLPNIIILFLGIALLETTGYMSRVAFLLDGFFHKFGLHGKSFIPLVTGFGCSVPAYMAARTLKNEKDRLITLFIIGFMSCGARLPIYVLFAGAFFGQEHAGNILFIIYISGAMLGLFMAKALKTFVFKGDDEPFVMEMPKYRMPSLKLIWHTVYGQAKSYLNKAGTFILAASVLVWFASNYPKDPTLETQYQTKIEQVQNSAKKAELNNELQSKLLEQSYLGKIGHASEAFFEPLGMDWRMSVALEAGLAAKEVVVSTLGVLYSLGDQVDQESNSLIAQIRAQIPFASAIAFIVFVMVYLPCFAASAVFAKEAGGWKYLAYLFFMTTASAWILSFLVYRVTLLIAGG
ncbi:ferrous iron transport protein B [Sulfurovum sp. NBC37-1]|uniref:ferrous iron transport protein B n=1 Tax=Sulfurovum sp. (strain NBC37-1) TaxID=387093 RepID=UPI00015874C3|nr:ferrous iron transport protein B [Sulfurovum sp. NBC37-1]BAF71763.1 ferrous iron transport protein B [Sulfurovum sp. NBC37-1]